jgi:hypothetical protein
MDCHRKVFEFLSKTLLQKSGKLVVPEMGIMFLPHANSSVSCVCSGVFALGARSKFAGICFRGIKKINREKLI